MCRNRFRLSRLAAAVALAVGSTAVLAAPTISRLTPPSNPIVDGAATLARFLPGQKFDLQTTVRPDAGTTVTSVVFKVDGKSVVNVKAVGGNPVNTSIVTAGLVAGVPAGTAVVSYRGYSKLSSGLHTLSATATQSDG